jgi:fructose-1,6-bisphosphatase I
VIDADWGSGLEEVLDGIEDVPGRAAARAVIALAGAARDLAAFIARPVPGERLGSTTGGANSDGDAQRKLDLIAEDLCRGALATAGVGPYLSEEAEDPMILDPDGTVAVAIDPLDGSSNIDVNGVIGTIFSILPATLGEAEPARAFMVTGRAQLAAGFFMYGPQTTLVLSLGQGVQVFTLDPASGTFLLVERALKIPLGTAEFAINASNQRHWTPAVRHYVEDCARGAEGPHGRNFNMRWCGSLVADAYRIFTRGGVFLYPSDSREGYENGRLRLLYEASPIAFLAEQAGGGATDGERPILDIPADRPHQRAPLVTGSADKVERIARYHHDAELARRGPPVMIVAEA